METVEDQVARGARILPDGIARACEVLCGCGDSEAVWEWVRDYLRDCNPEAWAFAPSSAPEWISMYLLDHLGLTEHGTTVAYSWLTEDGKAALAFLEEYGPAWKRGTEWWIDSSGTTWSDSN